jgi:hypothetical protein
MWAGTPLLVGVLDCKWDDDAGSNNHDESDHEWMRLMSREFRTREKSIYQRHKHLNTVVFCHE